MLYLKTKDAVKELSISASTLRRNRDIFGGCLIEGKDYLTGLTPTAPILWNIQAIRVKFHHQGMLMRGFHHVMPNPYQ